MYVLCASNMLACDKHTALAVDIDFCWHTKLSLFDDTNCYYTSKIERVQYFVEIF